MTLISDGQVLDTTYAETAAVLSEAEISAVEWIAVVINAWIRIAISGRMPANPK